MYSGRYGRGDMMFKQGIRMRKRYYFHLEHSWFHLVVGPNI